MVEVRMERVVDPSEEDFEDDLITLLDTGVDLLEFEADEAIDGDFSEAEQTNVEQPCYIEGVSSYGQRSTVPIAVFNNNRNLLLLKELKPMSVQVVDCSLYPAYYREQMQVFKSKQNVGFVKQVECGKGADSYESVESQTSDCNHIQGTEETDSNRSAVCVGETNIESEVSLKIKTAPSTTAPVKSTHSNFQKNIGLIGMKITPGVSISKNKINNRVKSSSKLRQVESGNKTNQNETDPLSKGANNNNNMAVHSNKKMSGDKLMQDNLEVTNNNKTLNEIELNKIRITNESKIVEDTANREVKVHPSVISGIEKLKNGSNKSWRDDKKNQTSVKKLPYKKLLKGEARNKLLNKIGAIYKKTESDTKVRVPIPKLTLKQKLIQSVSGSPEYVIKKYTANKSKPFRQKYKNFFIEGDGKTSPLLPCSNLIQKDKKGDIHLGQHQESDKLRINSTMNLEQPSESSPSSSFNPESNEVLNRNGENKLLQELLDLSPRPMTSTKAKEKENILNLSNPMALSMPSLDEDISENTLQLENEDKINIGAKTSIKINNKKSSDDKLSEKQTWDSDLRNTSLLKKKTSVKDVTARKDVTSRIVGNAEVKSGTAYEIIIVNKESTTKPNLPSTVKEAPLPSQQGKLKVRPISELINLSPPPYESRYRGGGLQNEVYMSKDNGQSHAIQNLNNMVAFIENPPGNNIAAQEVTNKVRQGVYSVEKETKNNNQVLPGQLNTTLTVNGYQNVQAVTSMPSESHKINVVQSQMGHYRGVPIQETQNNQTNLYSNRGMAPFYNESYNVNSSSLLHQQSVLPTVPYYNELSDETSYQNRYYAQEYVIPQANNNQATETFNHLNFNRANSNNYEQARLYPINSYTDNHQGNEIAGLNQNHEFQPTNQLSTSQHIDIMNTHQHSSELKKHLQGNYHPASQYNIFYKNHILHNKYYQHTEKNPSDTLMSITKNVTETSYTQYDAHNQSAFQVNSSAPSNENFRSNLVNIPLTAERNKTPSTSEGPAKPKPIRRKSCYVEMHDLKQVHIHTDETSDKPSEHAIRSTLEPNKISRLNRRLSADIIHSHLAAEENIQAVKDKQEKSSGYSPPILPIPTVKKSLELMSVLQTPPNHANAMKDLSKTQNGHIYNGQSEQFQSRVNYKRCPSKRKSTEERNEEVKKKISLDEYKRRLNGEVKFVDLRNNTNANGSDVPCDHVSMLLNRRRKSCYENQNVDLLDLGYDSDSTVKLLD